MSLGTDVLRDVSRSFYLSIRILPRDLRAPVAVAYLLARATDTIADTGVAAATRRVELLDQLASVIQRGGSPDEIVREFAPLQSNPAERRLIESLAECLEWLARLSEEDRADVRRVLALINEGQRLDVVRFATPASLQNAEELRRYTYFVAGCVGEFWTDVCARYLPNVTSRTVDEMRSLGADYGRGLQLINILRDFGADLKNGRCYLPAEELGVAAATSIDRARFAEVFERWLNEAERNVARGIEYAASIRHARVRIATVLPALIGGRTIALLRDAGVAVLDRKVKVDRREVRAIVAQTVITLANPKLLEGMFDRLRR